jgi:hypothetical protein
VVASLLSSAQFPSVADVAQNCLIFIADAAERHWDLMRTWVAVYVQQHVGELLQNTNVAEELCYLLRYFHEEAMTMMTPTDVTELYHRSAERVQAAIVVLLSNIPDLLSFDLLKQDILPRLKHRAARNRVDVLNLLIKLCVSGQENVIREVLDGEDWEPHIVEGVSDEEIDRLSTLCEYLGTSDMYNHPW